MITFKEFLENIQEQVVTKSTSDIGITNNNDGDGGDDGDDDEEGWDWDNLKKYDSALIQWASNDPFAKRIKNAILERIFNEEPELDVAEYFGDDDNEHDFSPSGEITLKIEWKMPVDSIEDALLVTLRKSTVWKPLGIQPNQLWNVLDKGDVFEYVYYHIRSSIVGHNPEIYEKHHRPEKPEWQRLDPIYFTKQKDWLKDKQTIEKYAKFMLYQKDEELKKYVQEYLPFDVDLQKVKESVRGLVWEDNFDASCYVYYRYNKIGE